MHQAGNENQVIDALNCKEVDRYVIALIEVQIDFLEILKMHAKEDITYGKFQ